MAEAHSIEKEDVKSSLINTLHTNHDLPQQRSLEEQDNDQKSKSIYKHYDAARNSNFVITTLARKGTANNNNNTQQSGNNSRHSKQQSIYSTPRSGGVFIAVNDWSQSKSIKSKPRTKEPIKTTATTTNETKPRSSGLLFAQHCDRTRQAKINVNGFFTFSKGKQQHHHNHQQQTQQLPPNQPLHIYENECVVERAAKVCAAVAAAAAAAAESEQQQQQQLNQEESDGVAGGQQPIYAIVNKQNKIKKKFNESNAIMPTLPAVVATLTDNEHNNNNGQQKSQMKTNSDNMGNLVHTDQHTIPTTTTTNTTDTVGAGYARLTAYNSKNVHVQEQQQQQQRLEMSVEDDRTTTENSIYAKVWKGPRKPSESKL